MYGTRFMLMNLSQLALTLLPQKGYSKLARYSIAAGKPRQVWTPAVGANLYKKLKLN